MKAIIYEKYGTGSSPAQRGIKPNPKDNGVLIKVHATTVTSRDVRIRCSTYSHWFWLPTVKNWHELRE